MKVLIMFWHFIPKIHQNIRYTVFPHLLQGIQRPIKCVCKKKANACKIPLKKINETARTQKVNWDLTGKHRNGKIHRKVCNLFIFLFSHQGYLIFSKFAKLQVCKLLHIIFTILVLSLRDKLALNTQFVHGNLAKNTLSSVFSTLNFYNIF